MYILKSFTVCVTDMNKYQVCFKKKIGPVHVVALSLYLYITLSISHEMTLRLKLGGSSTLADSTVCLLIILPWMKYSSLLNLLLLLTLHCCTCQKEIQNMQLIFLLCLIRAQLSSTETYDSVG